LSAIHDIIAPLETGNIMLTYFLTLTTLNVAQSFLFDSTTTAVTKVGSHGNSLNSWQTCVLNRLDVLDQKSIRCESGLTTLDSHSNILGQELLNINVTVNSVGKLLYCNIDYLCTVCNYYNVYFKYTLIIQRMYTKYVAVIVCT
jgi:hypothetical protein